MNDGKSLVQMIDEALKAGDVELPVFDQVAMQVYQEVQAGDMDADRLTELMQQDPVLVAETLRVANSSFFSGLSEVTTLRDAIVRLGMKQISSIAMMASQKRMYSASESRFESRLSNLWRHSAAVAFGARWLAEKTGHRKQADEAFVAGLLHDVGKTSLLRIIEELAHRSDELNVADEVVDVTVQQLYADHGGELMEMWNLPEVFRRVVREQKSEELDEKEVLVAIVRLADKACAREGISDVPDPSVDLETSPEVESLGLNPIQIAELQVVLEDAAQAA